MRIMRIRSRLLICLLAPLLAGACASIVSDNESTTYIETDPQSARCVLHGQDFERVVQTPESILLPANAAPITLACEAEGYRTTSAELDTKMDGWILGNVIFGGIVGIVIDAARGAGQKYPSKITVVLEPEQFPTAAKRDEWYDRQREATEEKWDKIISRLKAGCTSLNQRECDDNAGRARKQRDAELKELENRRLAAAVAATARP